MVNWIYSTPTWVWGTMFVASVTALSCLGMVVTSRLVSGELRRKENEVTSPAMGAVGVAYAVLLAFIAVAAWENFGNADKITDLEATYIGDLYRGTIGLPEDKAAPLRADIKKYIDQVTNIEWKSQRLGEVNQAGRPTLVHIHRLIAAVNPATPGEAAIVSELYRTLNALYDARRTRILAADNGIPDVVWWIVGIGTTLTIGFTFLFGANDFRMHLVATGMVAISMSLVIVLIIALDRPFRGDLSISTQAYDNARGSIAAVDRQ
jgi:hypothetical protein